MDWMGNCNRRQAREMDALLNSCRCLGQSCTLLCAGEAGIRGFGRLRRLAPVPLRSPQLLARKGDL
jgi:hypothetical protein